MIVMRLMGGLGNQLFQYATGRALADRLGGELLLDLSWFATQTKRHYSLTPYALRAEVADPKLLTRIIAREPGNKRPSLAVTLRAVAKGCRPRFMPLLREGPGVDPTRVPGTGNGVVLEGYWQRAAYFADHAEAIRRDLSLITPPSGKNAEILARIREAGTAAVMVHVRRGDYVSESSTNAFHGTCSPEYYRLGARAVAQQVPHPVWFVFSDDIGWARDNILPHAENRFFVQHNGEKEAHEDIRLMSACRRFIVANSSFSWWGAWLSGVPGKRIIGPTPWFTDPAHRHTSPADTDWCLLERDAAPGQA